MVFSNPRDTPAPSWISTNPLLQLADQIFPLQFSTFITAAKLTKVEPWAPQKHYDDAYSYVMKNGVSKIKDFFEEKLKNSAGEVKVKTAIVGTTGSGKSTFINKLLRLKDTAKGAAKVDVIECTDDWKRYEDPDNANIEYWDLPGMGTDNFPAKTYFQDVKLNEYDTFVIFIDTRFREDDLELAREIKSHGKKYFFVRSKIDQDVRSIEFSDPESFNEAAVLAKIRSKCVEKLGDLLSDKEKIFLISCQGFEKCGEKVGEKYREKYQLEPLIKANRDALSQNQRDAMICLLQRASKKALEEKVQALGGSKWKSALWSGAAAAIPFLSVAVDVGLIVKEFNGYKHQLGIPEEGSDEFEKLDPKSKAKVGTFLKILAEIATKGVAAFGILAAEATVEQVFSYLPLGLLIACPLSYGTTYCVLYYTLQRMADAAFAILEGTVKQLLDDN